MPRSLPVVDITDRRPPPDVPCREDPEAWFPGVLSGPAARVAARVCAQCGWNAQCWELARSLGEPDGVWAGRVWIGGAWRQLPVVCLVPGCEGEPRSRAGMCRYHMGWRACEWPDCPAEATVAVHHQWYCLDHGRRTQRVWQRLENSNRRAGL
jgi:hypothetical protein